jgi:MerR family transcriptional regulator/heat shock protein HspR
MGERDNDQPLYMIGVAARLVGCHPHTLRQYEDLGLLRPYRTGGNVRLFSDRDIDRARQIREYTQGLGINRAGVEQILRLLGRMEQMRADIEREFREEVLVMRAEIDRLTGMLRSIEDLGAGGAEVRRGR